MGQTRVPAGGPARAPPYELEKTMKKERSFKKLSLNRETVRSLDDRRIAEAVGGAVTMFCTVTQCSNCPNCSRAC
jgi:hypothetical protein